MRPGFTRKVCRPPLTGGGVQAQVILRPQLPVPPTVFDDEGSIEDAEVRDSALARLRAMPSGSWRGRACSILLRIGGSRDVVSTPPGSVSFPSRSTVDFGSCRTRVPPSRFRSTVHGEPQHG